MKTLCLLILALLTSSSQTIIESPENKLDVTEILKNWDYQESRLDVKISKVKVGVAEISYNQTPLTDADN